jgi:hypothetical protein
VANIQKKSQSKTNLPWDLGFFDFIRAEFFLREYLAD